MYYANSFLTQLSPNKAKKVHYAPQENAFQLSGRHSCLKSCATFAPH